MAQGQPGRDDASPRHAEDMGAVVAAVCADDVGGGVGVVVEVERAVGIVAVAVTGRVPGEDAQGVTEAGELRGEAVAAAADAVQHQHGRSGAVVGDVDHDACSRS